jgi:hypothetical protein
MWEVVLYGFSIIVTLIEMEGGSFEASENQIVSALVLWQEYLVTNLLTLLTKSA